MDRHIQSCNQPCAKKHTPEDDAKASRVLLSSTSPRPVKPTAAAAAPLTTLTNLRPFWARVTTKQRPTLHDDP